MNNPHRLYVEKLVLRSGANGVQIGCWSSEMLQIAGESGSRGLVLGTHTIWGGVLWNREPGSYIAWYQYSRRRLSLQMRHCSCQGTAVRMACIKDTADPACIALPIAVFEAWIGVWLLGLKLPKKVTWQTFCAVLRNLPRSIASGWNPSAIS